MNAEIRLDDKEESLAAYREYIALETQEKDPARIQVPLLFSGCGLRSFRIRIIFFAESFGSIQYAT
jgi:hypothetical protein